ncbi:hypothetical protein J21TS7_60810 [Paenibacillus cineris]|uniref:Uncharacterized protein n=1 Tax=Paenibacillus cineris TaxID=237530 RepID=A0ABQ4LP11_9BACL|nr:hypothetical protein J21TS7_60810 [Paenibacillus cineris]
MAAREKLRSSATVTKTFSVSVIMAWTPVYRFFSGKRAKAKAALKITLSVTWGRAAINHKLS